MNWMMTMTMSKIFLTGDFERNIDRKDWSKLSNTTKDDYLIILGDFGVLWNNDEDDSERFYKDWFNDQPWTTLFIDGNHENFYRLKQLKPIDMFDSIVGKISNSIYYLYRGEVYTINNLKFLCMGGATSIDRHMRIDGVSWWKEEIPTYHEFDRCMANAIKHAYVDYILTHTLPYNAILSMDFSYIPCSVSKFLSNLAPMIKCKRWFSGHFHINKSYEKYQILYDEVLQLC